MAYMPTLTNVGNYGIHGVSGIYIYIAKLNVYIYIYYIHTNRTNPPTNPPTNQPTKPASPRTDRPNQNPNKRPLSAQHYPRLQGWQLVGLREMCGCQQEIRDGIRHQVATQRETTLCQLRAGAIALQHLSGSAGFRMGMAGMAVRVLVSKSKQNRWSQLPVS